MSTQFELRAIVPSELADELEAYFFETETAHWGVMQKERGDPYEVFGFFPDEATADKELEILRAEFKDLPEDFELTTIHDEDWQNAYKEFVKPWSDRQLHWIPLWERENLTPPEGSAVVYLDAGMAFGTGAHETTRLCARRLLDYLDANPDKTETIELVDAGCGSGILALSASGLGFKNVRGFDFDPLAIEVCETNLIENSHIPKVAFEVADLEQGLVDRPQVELMLANIQTDVLIPHSDPIVMAIKKGGTLALSGILTKELDQVRDHYKARFADLRGVDVKIDSREDGEWADLLIELS